MMDAMAPQTALDVKQAVSTACAHLSGLFPVGDTRLLEEVESLDDDGWSVTLSFELPRREPYKIGGLVPALSSESRVYKVVTLDAAGVLLSVKIRSLTAPAS
jgi:adenine/guanine phosphoribosyltransferase-like PRPP-binding protein